MLAEDVTTAPLLDHRGLDLEAADRVVYRVEQAFRYEYDTPVESVRQRLVFLPPARHGDQRRRHHRIEVRGAPSHRWTGPDAAGNTIVKVFAPRVERRVEFHLTAVLDRTRSDGPTRLPAAALHDPRLLTPTALTEADPHLTEAAAGLPGTGLDLADSACAWVHAALVYEFGSTSVTTTAAQALAGGRGVCQDSAHLMLALCRARGLPARYVSGHLLGQGGTHAWVEVVVPHPGGAVAVAFDPCNGRRPDAAYVTVATGRDYADVAPTSGSYVGAPGGRLTCDRVVGVVALG